MRIAIVNGNPQALAALQAFVLAEPGLELAWTATTGAAALTQCITHRPELLLMDLLLPDGTGADAIHRIMAEAPCPIVVTTTSAQGNAPYEALARGAMDAVALLYPGPGEIQWSAMPLEPLRRKLAQFRRILGTAPAPAPPATAIRSPRLLAIGASTGGPAVIARLLGALAGPLPMPCVIVQHIDAEFADGMVRWLTSETKQSVTLALAGVLPEPGGVYLSGGGGHLVLDKAGRFAYRQEPLKCPYRPSIDEFFLSACSQPLPAWALLLTGMGRDGARGLAKLRSAGWTTIAQEPASCAVAGMPQAAIDLAAAELVLDPARMASMLSQLTA